MTTGKKSKRKQRAARSAAAALAATKWAKPPRGVDIGVWVYEQRKAELTEALRALSLGKPAHPLWHVGGEAAAQIFLQVLATTYAPQLFFSTLAKSLEKEDIDSSLMTARALDQALSSLPDPRPTFRFAPALIQRFGVEPAFLPAGASVTATQLPDAVSGDQQMRISDGESRAIERRHQPWLASNPRRLTVGVNAGAGEITEHGVLSCWLAQDAVCVALFKAGQPVGRTLRYVPADPTQLHPGASIPEEVFGCAVREFLCSPWHDGVAQDALWTVHGLREKGTLEYLASGVDRS